MTSKLKLKDYSLEDYSLNELNSKELKETNGGLILLIVWGFYNGYKDTEMAYNNNGSSTNTNKAKKSIK